MFDYKKSLKENTIGHTLFITYSINNKISVSQHWFEQKDNLLVHLDDWQKHFDKQVLKAAHTGVDYCYSLTILRAVYFTDSKAYMSTTMTRDELVAEINETKAVA
jgi:hypothetical protein